MGEAMIVSENPHIEMHNRDCMELMAEYPDNHFDLAIIDPEYREENQPTQHMRAKGDMRVWHGKSGIKFFRELFRVSCRQIVWGGNYYTSILDETNNWILWHKNNDGTGFSMVEMGWVSGKGNTRLVSIRAPQVLQLEGSRIHPTQKPVALYKWLLTNYAKPGDKILDTHGGSGSICIACYDLGFDLTWTELDKEYYEAAVKRFKNHAAQGQLFREPEPLPEQKKLL